jgi:thiol-disulfide isomerase/thioredoxin
MKRLAAAALLALTGLALADPAGTEPGQKVPAAPAETKASTTLGPGDAAPALKVEKWLKGDAVKKFEPGKAYIIEFWATWCGPCIASMPHLSQLQKEYKDKGLTIIGMTSQDTRGNTLDSAKKMVEAKGDGMGYTVAWDTGRQTNEAYMTAAKQGGIPCSFVIDKDSKIAYIGHPMFLDLVLDKVLAGKWDYKAGPAEVDATQKALFAALGKGQNDPASALKDLAEVEAKYPAVSKISFVTGFKYQMQMQSGDTEGAQKTAVAMYDSAVKHKDGQALNELAWNIVSPDSDMEHKDLDFALKCAEAGVKVTDRKDPMILDTLARAYFVKGDKDKAISTIKEAIALADDDYKSEFEKTLKEYQNAK